MAVIAKIIKTCFDRFNEISAVKVGYFPQLEDTCHGLRVRGDACYSKITGKPYNANGITAKYYEDNGSIKFYNGCEVVCTLPRVTGLHKAVWGHFLHALERSTVSAATPGGVMAIMSSIIDGVLSEANSGKIAFTTAEMLKSIETLYAQLSVSRHDLGVVSAKCAEILKITDE